MNSRELHGKRKAEVSALPLNQPLEVTGFSRVVSIRNAAYWLGRRVTIKEIRPVPAQRRYQLTILT
jgi:hypothetical protein